MFMLSEVRLPGIELAIIEVGLIFMFSYTLKKNDKDLLELNNILFYWAFFTFVTGIWETAFLIQYNTTCNTAQKLLEDKSHVWTTKYDLTYIAPWKFSNIFYAEYGAYADREYMLVKDDWSRVIEGSHAILCGIFAFLSIIFKIAEKKAHFYVSISVCMGAQLMNSVLYMINYFHQMKDPTNVNYITQYFPAGTFLEKRPFMYINIFWTIMPLYIILILLYIYKDDKS